MLFWIFVIGLVMGVACIICGDWMYDNTRFDTEWLKCIGWVIAVLMAFAILASGIAMAVYHIYADALVAENHERYKSLTYQLENDLYDNDNDIGKKALYDEIREWNEDLAYFQAIQDDFWLGIFHPNVFDQFEFIAYEQGDGQ